MLRNDTEKYKKKYGDNSLRFFTRQSQKDLSNLPIRQQRYMSTKRSQKSTNFKVQSVQKNILFKQSSQRQFYHQKNITINNLLSQKAMLQNNFVGKPKKQLKIYLHHKEFACPVKKIRADTTIQNTITSENSKQQFRKIASKILWTQRNLQPSSLQPQPMQPKNNNYFKIDIKAYQNEQNHTTNQNSQQLLRELKINDLFFCAGCLLYIFKIEIKYHFPTCQKKIPINDLSSQEKVNIGWEKLSNLMRLAQYTQTKTDLINKQFIKYKQQWNKIHNRSSLFFEDQDIEPHSKYYLLEDIDKAMQLTYNRLLKNTKFSTTCKITNC